MNRSLNRTLPLLAIGSALIVLAILFPTAWYDHLPKREGLVYPELRGVTLFKFFLVLDGLFLYLLSYLVRESPTPTTGRWNATLLPFSESAVPMTGKDYLVLVIITALGLILRIYRLDSDLWMDELSTVIYYRNAPFYELLAGYVNSNNHMLNTALIKICLELIGESEVSVRLPALVFGVMTIPLLYIVVLARAGRFHAISSACFLAVSYHHIFFSQNARGYTAYIFFSLFSLHLLEKALQTSQVKFWAGYVLTAVLALTAHLTAGFVVASQGLICLGLIINQRKDGLALNRGIGGIIISYVAIALMSLTIYANIIPQVYAFVQDVYKQEGSGFKFISLEFVQETLAGFAIGFAGGTGLVLAILLIGLTGFVRIMRRLPFLGIGLFLPNLLIAIFVVVRNLTVSPRFFLLLIPLALLTAAECISWVGLLVAQYSGRPRLKHYVSISGLAVLVFASVISLQDYYEHPKQNFREAILNAKSIMNEESLVVGVYLAGWGVEYYAPKLGLEEEKQFVSIRSLEELKELEAVHAKDSIILITTFHRALEIDFNELFNYIKANWRVTSQFRGTVGDGDMYVWITEE